MALRFWSTVYGYRQVSCFFAGLLGLFALALTACAPRISPSQPVSSPLSIELLPDEDLGQTFVARDDGLQGMEVYLDPGEDAAGKVILHIRERPDSAVDLTASQWPIEPGAREFIRFNFPVQTRSMGNPYFALIEFRGQGTLKVGSAPGDAYQDGALYQGFEPLDAQLTFRLVYDPWVLLLGVLRRMIVWAGFLLLGILLYSLPGFALLTIPGPKTVHLDWFSRFVLGAGIGLALYPLLFLLIGLAGARMGIFYGLAPPILAGLALIWHYRKRPWQPLYPRWLAWWRSAHRWPDLAVVSLCVLIAGGRFFIIKDIEVPLWGDSYQHTMITQLLVERGGLFESWSPYAALETFTYHFGFHAQAAVFQWLAQTPAPLTVLVVGQFLNILAVLAVYPLALQLTGQRWAGVFAVLIAGLLSPMPNTYVNWGRYTQLAGQAILPAAVWLAWAVLEKPRHNWRLITLAWLALGGLALTHYRVLIFAIIFFLAYLLFNIWQSDRKALLMRVWWLGAGAGILFLPWFLRVFGGKILTVLAAQLTTPPQSASVWRQYNAISLADLPFYLPTEIWVLLLTSLGWALTCRKRPYLVIGTWWALVTLAANPHWIGLPGVGAISTFTVLLAAYLPASLLIGTGAGDLLNPRLWGHHKLEKGHVASASRDLPEATGPQTMYATNNRTQLALLILTVTLGIWGAQRRLADLNLDQSVLVTRPDIQAANWIKENTEEDARFLVNGFFAFGDSVLVGSDAGWWLPLLSDRDSTIPPINYSFERGPRPDYLEWINALVREIQRKGIAHEEVIAELAARGVTHVFIGQRRGRVNYTGPDVLNINDLSSSPSFTPVYQQDRVWIFKVNP